MYLGGSRGGVPLLNHAKIFVFTDLKLKTISSLTSDLKKLIQEGSNFRFSEGVVPLNYIKTFV